LTGRGCEREVLGVEGRFICLLLRRRWCYFDLIRYLTMMWVERRGLDGRMKVERRGRVGEGMLYLQSKIISCEME
jgi:hypothetical protein